MLFAINLLQTQYSAKLLLLFRKTMSTKNSFSDIKNIFQHSVASVQPKQLLNNVLHVEKNNIKIKGLQFFVDKNIYVIGFGKAVLGMALEIEFLLQNHIVSGIISVPIGLKDSMILKNQKRFLSRIEVLEGAQNNIPDKDSELAAHRISELVSSLKLSDIIFVLISGGGSSLLSYPKPPLTLEDKKKVINALASKGATIEEINTVRKQLSVLKGGGLAELAKPAQVISLILSDIIGDPLGLIASGPTVENVDDPSLSLKVIEKYNISDDIPQTAIKLLTTTKSGTKNNSTNSHVCNFIIGNNTTALQEAANRAKELLYTPVILTNKLKGIASVVGCKIIQLIESALNQNLRDLVEISHELNIETESANMLLLESRTIHKESKGLCILFGGETTVQVIGNGTGGRNQELALAASLELSKRKLNHEIVLLSAGTDGIDGPTDAAGAIATSSVIDSAIAENLNPACFLQNNDSYNFYCRLHNGYYHLKTGHTGTNVMDIIIVLVKNVNKEK